MNEPGNGVSGEAFYEDFKAALRAVGLRFGDMHLATVHVHGSKVTVSYGNTSVVYEYGTLNPSKE